MTPLKPCPFCGGKARHDVRGLWGDEFHWIYCASCDASGPHVEQWDYRIHKTYNQLAALAARKWNRRTK